jgi:preprotein translocase subunit SecG
LLVLTAFLHVLCLLLSLLLQAASSALHEAAWGGNAEVVAEMMARGVPHDLACAVSVAHTVTTQSYHKDSV